MIGGWSLRFDASEVPQGYYWILYTYVDGAEQGRDRLCPGTEIPNVVFQAGTNQFLTLEKNWILRTLDSIAIKKSLAAGYKGLF